MFGWVACNHEDSRISSIPVSSVVLRKTLRFCSFFCSLTPSLLCFTYLFYSQSDLNQIVNSIGRISFCFNKLTQNLISTAFEYSQCASGSYCLDSETPILPIVTAYSYMYAYDEFNFSKYTLHCNPDCTLCQLNELKQTIPHRNE